VRITIPRFVCLPLTKEAVNVFARVCCVSVCLSVCLEDYSKTRAWMKCCVSTDVRIYMDELIAFSDIV